MSAIEYTDQQRLALTTRRGPVAVDAGAGCGKTFVLTERFLSHLEPTEFDPSEAPAELDELVAITFTDAAAREMRDRIRGRCRERLLAATGDAVAFWRRLLRSLDSARVSTIHSFASGLIREHAIELGVDPAFSVLDPAEAKVLKVAAVDRALRDRLAPRDGQVPDELIATAAEFDLSGLRKHVETLAEHAADPAFKKWLKATPDDSIEAWRDHYLRRVAPQYARDFLADPGVVELRELLREAVPVTPGFADRVADLSEALFGLTTATDPDEALRALQPLLVFRDPAIRKDICTVKDWPASELKKRFTALLKSLRGRLDKQRRAGSRESMERAAQLGLRVLSLAADASRRYGEAKRERGVLDNDDLLVEAHRLLTDPSLSDARQRIAGRVRVLLVDEFQDTDRRQAELAQAIVGETTGEDDRALFLVGDFKQSIYRFRGAEPGVFQERRDATPESGRLTLSLNFRSQPAVLDFVNTTFGGIFGEDYAPLSPSRPQVAPRPAVEMLWTPRPENSLVGVQRVTEAASIAGRIRAILDDGESLIYDKATESARPAALGDFAILFRALSDVAAYEHALREAGLDYYLVGGHAFYAQQEIYDVINLLRTLLSESDEIALAGVLRSPLFGLTDETLFWLAKQDGLNAGLFGAQPPRELTDDQRRTAEHARDTLTTLRQRKDRVAASELLRQAWDATGYEASLVADFLGTRKLANLEKLHEQARQADASGAGLRGLAARLTEFVNSPPKEALAATTAGDADVVRLMTVHGSKGLEFPIVILPDLNRSTSNNDRPAVFDPQLGPLVSPPARPEDGANRPPVGYDFWRATEKPAEAEEQDRLFYVACTRAADRLILSSCYDSEMKLEGPWLKRLSERFDLTTGALLDDDGEQPPLVTVTPPVAAPAVAGPARNGPSLHDALESLDAGQAAPSAPPRGVAPVEVLPEELVTFSVSRLSGRLQREAPSAEAPSAEAPAVVTHEAIDPRRLGTLVHAVIERLDPTLMSWTDAISHWADALAPQHLRRNVSAGAAEAKRLAHRFVETEAWEAMRSATELRREVEFLLPWPADGDPASPAVIRGYLDALYQDGQGRWRIVDYKTNAVDAAGVPKLAAGYALQMAVYAHAVEAATGARPESLSLVFLSPGVTHPIGWDDAAHAASARTITDAIAAARQSATEPSP